MDAAARASPHRGSSHGLTATQPAQMAMQLSASELRTSSNSATLSVRSQHAAAFHAASRRMYVFGGTDAHDGYALFYLDCGSHATGNAQQWVRVDVAGTGPSKRVGAAGVIWADRMYIFGGMRPSGLLQNEFLNDMCIYDISLRRWSKRVLPEIQPRAGHVASLLDESAGVLLVHGGRARHGMVLSDTYLVRLSTLEVRQIHPQPSTPSPVLPSPRFAHAGCSLSVAPAGDSATSRIVVIHGGQDADGKVLNDIWAFDSGSLEWSPVDAYMQASTGAGSSAAETSVGASRRGHNMVRVTPSIAMVLGGYDGADSSSSCLFIAVASTSSSFASSSSAQQLLLSPPVEPPGFFASVAPSRMKGGGRPPPRREFASAVLVAPDAFGSRGSECVLVMGGVHGDRPEASLWKFDIGQCTEGFKRLTELTKMHADARTRLDTTPIPGMVRIGHSRSRKTSPSGSPVMPVVAKSGSGRSADVPDIHSESDDEFDFDDRISELTVPDQEEHDPGRKPYHGVRVADAQPPSPKQSGSPARGGGLPNQQSTRTSPGRRDGTVMAALQAPPSQQQQQQQPSVSVVVPMIEALSSSLRSLHSSIMHELAALDARVSRLEEVVYMHIASASTPVDAGDPHTAVAGLPPKQPAPGDGSSPRITGGSAAAPGPRPEEIALIGTDSSADCRDEDGRGSLSQQNSFRSEPSALQHMELQTIENQLAHALRFLREFPACEQEAGPPSDADRPPSHRLLLLLLLLKTVHAFGPVGATSVGALTAMREFQRYMAAVVAQAQLKRYPLSKSIAMQLDLEAPDIEEQIRLLLSKFSSKNGEKLLTRVSPRSMSSSLDEPSLLENLGSSVGSSPPAHSHWAAAPANASFPSAESGVEDPRESDLLLPDNGDTAAPSAKPLSRPGHGGGVRYMMSSRFLHVFDHEGLIVETDIGQVNPSLYYQDDELAEPDQMED